MTLEQVIKKAGDNKDFKRESYPSDKRSARAYNVFIGKDGLFHQIQIVSGATDVIEIDNIVSLRAEDVTATDWYVVSIIDLPVCFVSNPSSCESTNNLSTPTT